MPKCKIQNYDTSQVEIGIDFGGNNIYDVGGTLVYAPYGGTSLTQNGTDYTLNPLGLVSTDCVDDVWEVISHENIGTCNWTITVQNTLTSEIKSGVLPFNINGKVYELECESGVWVMASCGGYATEKTWDGQGADECIRLKGTNEIIYIVCPDGQYFDFASESCVPYSSYNFILNGDCYLKATPKHRDTSHVVCSNVGNYYQISDELPEDELFMSGCYTGTFGAGNTKNRPTKEGWIVTYDTTDGCDGSVYNNWVEKVEIIDENTFKVSRGATSNGSNLLSVGWSVCELVGYFGLPMTEQAWYQKYEVGNIYYWVTYDWVFEEYGTIVGVK